MRYGIFLILLFVSICVKSQVLIGTAPGNPNPNAMLDVQSNSKGLLIPRMDSNARKLIPHTKGLMVYDTTTSSFWFSNGSNWQKSPSSEGDHDLVPKGKNPGDMLYWDGNNWALVGGGSQGQMLFYCNGAPVWGGCLPIVTTKVISNITGVSASSGGNVLSDRGYPVLSRGVVWSTNPSPTIALPTKTVNGAGLGAYSSNITGLTTNTTYYIRAYATNSSGTVYGNEVSFTTNDLDLDGGLVAYYPFNGNANDSSGNGNNASFNNATLTVDRFGNANGAYQFNGTSNYMVVPNSASLNPSLISMVAIVKPTGFYQGVCHGNVIFNKGNDDFNLASRYRFRFYDGLSNPGNCSGSPVDELHQNFAPDFGSNGPVTAAYSPYIVKDQWYSVVFTFDGSTAKLYINGALISSRATSVTYTPNNHDLYIGRLNDLTFPYWLNGVIDEIRIYSRALSTNEAIYLSSH